VPLNRARYPVDWEAVSLRIREREGWGCKWCHARHDEPHPITGNRVVLTVAHLNHRPMDCRESNLAALCQRCHLNYDRPRHIAAARRRRHSARASGDLFLTV